MSTVKPKDQLLLDYRKSNKTRRKKIVAKAGFASEAEYISYLMGPDAVDDKPLIHNVHIIDISWSMFGDKLTSAVNGVNDEIDELKKSTSVDYLQTIVEFSESKDIRNVVWRVPINNTPRYSTRAISGTALYEAVGKTLQLLRLNKRPGEKILVKIFTDGEENSSRGEFRDPKVLADLIKVCEEDDFTITFIGTSRDIKTVVSNLRIDFSNTLAHDNTARGIHMASMDRIGATQAYAKKVLLKQDVKKGFYKSLKKQ